MRSRYAAFALGLGDYLVHTLADSHVDRASPPEALALELAGVHHRQRFLGLTIVHAASAGDCGEVLFYARVFERGVDRSFAELSAFVKQTEGWKYASGILVPRKFLPDAPASITRATFLALADRFEPK